MKILILGGTGFIGRRLVRELYQSGQKIFLLVRRKSLHKAKELFSDLNEITFILGDMENSDILDDVSTTTHLTDEVDCVVHLAANYNLEISANDAYLQNVVGTQNVLRFLPRLKNLKTFYYFSTYAVNQKLSGLFQEDELIDENSVFFDQYAKSKNNAEHLVRKLAPKNIQTIILRPGIIVGDSQTGDYDKEDGPYYFFKFIKEIKKIKFLARRLKFLPLPVMPNSLIPVLPVDTLVNWSRQIMLAPKDRPLSCYHLAPQSQVNTKDFLQRSIDLMKLDLKIVSIPLSEVFVPLFRIIQLPSQLVFYMQYQGQLDRSQLERDYPDLQAPQVFSYLPSLIKTYLQDEE